MKVEQKGHTFIVKDTKSDLSKFIENLYQNYNSFKNHNLIVDLTKNGNVTKTDFKRVKDLISSQKKINKSIVFVNDRLDFDTIFKGLIIVPTILEAHDIIEMEEIERDLGF